MIDERCWVGANQGVEEGMSRGREERGKESRAVYRGHGDGSVLEIFSVSNRGPARLEYCMHAT